MAKNEAIWKAVVNTLRKSEILKSYINEIIEGVREDIPKFPVIVLEPLNETEEPYTLPDTRRVIFQIVITCWIEVYKSDKQIIGEKMNKGILDIVRDVKNELEKDKTLDGTCLRFYFPSTSYSIETYPFRSAEITMAIEYVTKITER